jgi:hypothetical protein
VSTGEVPLSLIKEPYYLARGVGSDPVVAPVANKDAAVARILGQFQTVSVQEPKIGCDLDGDDFARVVNERL